MTANIKQANKCIFNIIAGMLSTVKKKPKQGKAVENDGMTTLDQVVREGLSEEVTVE